MQEDDDGVGARSRLADGFEQPRNSLRRSESGLCGPVVQADELGSSSTALPRSRRPGHRGSSRGTDGTPGRRRARSRSPGIARGARRRVSREAPRRRSRLWLLAMVATSAPPSASASQRARGRTEHNRTAPRSVTAVSRFTIARSAPPSVGAIAPSTVRERESSVARTSPSKWTSPAKASVTGAVRQGAPGGPPWRAPRSHVARP